MPWLCAVETRGETVTQLDLLTVVTLCLVGLIAAVLTVTAAVVYLAVTL